MNLKHCVVFNLGMHCSIHVSSCKICYLICSNHLCSYRLFDEYSNYWRKCADFFKCPTLVVYFLISPNNCLSCILRCVLGYKMILNFCIFHYYAENIFFPLLTEVFTLKHIVLSHAISLWVNIFMVF